MSLDDTVPADGDGVTTGVKVSELAGHIRTLKTDLNDGKLSIIGDNDGDTYVTVEETEDEDVIHFYTAGSERVKIDSDGKLYIGTEYFVKHLSGTDHLSTSFNVICRDVSGSHLFLSGGNAYNSGAVIRIHDGATPKTIQFYFDSTMDFYFNAGGKAYANDSWNTFSPVLPDVKRYDWVEVAKEDAYKPRKPDDLTMDKITEEDIEKYGKNIAKIAMANTRAIDYIAHVQRCILRSLINTRRMLYDIRQSTTKESTN